MAVVAFERQLDAAVVAVTLGGYYGGTVTGTGHICGRCGIITSCCGGIRSFMVVLLPEPDITVAASVSLLTVLDSNVAVSVVS